MTAVARIRLAHIRHPLPQLLAAALVGASESDSDANAGSAVAVTTHRIAGGAAGEHAGRLEESLEEGVHPSGPRSPLIGHTRGRAAVRGGQAVELTAVPEDALSRAADGAASPARPQASPGAESRDVGGAVVGGKLA